MTEGSSSSAVTPGLNPDAYRPSQYTFKPIGLKLYKPEITVHDDNMVLREPNVHLSVFNRKEKKYVRGYSGSSQVKQYYEALPARAKELVQSTGFAQFVELAGETTNDHV